MFIGVTICLTETSRKNDGWERKKKELTRSEILLILKQNHIQCPLFFIAQTFLNILLQLQEGKIQTLYTRIQAYF